jgi:glycosyltransferase involved in cell wall biosynthesis
MGRGVSAADEYEQIEARIVSLGIAAVSPETSTELISRASGSGLRVLTLTPFYPSIENSWEGGFIAEVLPQTQELGLKNEVIALRPFYRGRVHSAPSEIPCVWKKYFSLPGNLGLPTAGAFAASSLIRLVRKAHLLRPFDLIHAHAALPCGHAAERISAKLGIPFVVSVHGLDVFYERQAGSTQGAWCRRVCERVYRQARAVICISEKVRERLSREAVKTALIYSGVDTSIFSPGIEQKGPLIVLSVGNLIPTKGHAVLLRAFAQVVGVVPDCELEIIGDGPERESLVRLAAHLDISPQVRFVGRKDRIAVAEAMKRCAVFALPSFYEGLGCVYLEAMACAKPVIGCEGQGIDGIIEHGSNGLLVPPQSEVELSDELRMLLQNEDFRQRIGNAARNTVLEQHTLAHQATQLSDLYQECVA